MVAGGERRLVELVLDEQRVQRLTAGRDGVLLARNPGRHAGPAIEPGRVGRRGGGDDDGGEHPLGSARGAREGTWATAGMAEDGEAVDSERVRDREHVRQDVADRRLRIPGGAAVAGPVRTEEAHARLRRGREERLRWLARVGRAAVPEAVSYTHLTLPTNREV